jgi:hypothetical protein
VSYLYEWEWEAKTEQYQVREAPFTDEEVLDIYEKVKYTLIIKHLEDFVNQMKEKGYNIQIVGIEPYVKLSWTWEDKWFLFYTKRYYYYWLSYGARVKFLSDKPLEGSPLAPIVVSILAFVIKAVIAALCISIILYFAKEVIESSKTTKSVVRKYDPQTGKVTEEVITEETPTLFTGLTGLGLIILLIILATIFARREEKK